MLRPKLMTLSSVIKSGSGALVSRTGDDFLGASLFLYGVESIGCSCSVEV